MYQVNYEARVIEGALKGKRYHHHTTFDKKSDAIFFASKDGCIITPLDARNGAYVQENSVITNLTQFFKA